MFFCQDKSFCPKYDRLGLLRKYRQEKSIMGLSSDNNSKFLQTTGRFLFFSTPLALFGCSRQEKIHFSASCTYEKSLGKIPHALSQLQRDLNSSLMTVAGNAGVCPPIWLQMSVVLLWDYENSRSDTTPEPFSSWPRGYPVFLLLSERELPRPANPGNFLRFSYDENWSSTHCGGQPMP